MSNELFITMAGTGRVNPTIFLVKELINRGENVTYISIEQFREKIEKTGAKFKGIIIEKDKVTPEILKQSVVNILSDNNFKINSKKIGKSLREAGGFKNGVNEILNLYAHMNK